MKYASKKYKRRRRHQQKKKSELNKKKSEEKIDRDHHFNNPDEKADTCNDKTMTILQLGSASMFRLNVTVASREIVAVIDTEAEVTIISDKVFEYMQN